MKPHQCYFFSVEIFLGLDSITNMLMTSELYNVEDV